MMRDSTDGKRKTSNMARALAFRVGFSILLFLCIFAAMEFGYINRQIPTRDNKLSKSARETGLQ
jgi:hypothetical protein